MSGVWDAVRPELDTVPPRDPRLPVTSYIVCSSPRSGSGLLCRGLYGTGIAGTPAEYLNSNQREALSARWETGDDLHAYVAELRARRTSPAGTFGIKLHWDQVEHICNEVAHPSSRPTELFNELFPRSTYIHITRADIDRQAISLWTALHTGVWSEKLGTTAGPPTAVPYSWEGIDQCRAFIRRADRQWSEAFANAGIERVRVVYEQLVGAYKATIASTLQHVIGQSPDPGEIAEPDSRPQRNDRSEELFELFKRDIERLGGDRPASSEALPQVLHS